MLFRLSFVTLILALTAFGSPVKRDAATIKSDIKDVTSESVSLDDAVKAFPSSGGTFAEATVIQNATSALLSKINTARTHVIVSDALSEDDAGEILNLLGNVLPVVQSGCNDLVAKKDGFTAVGTADLIQQDLVKLKTEADEFGTALSAKMPADTQGGVQQWIDEVNAALDSATAAYSQTG